MERLTNFCRYAKDCAFISISCGFVYDCLSPLYSLLYEHISAKRYKPYLETGIPPLTCARLSYIKMKKLLVMQNYV